MPKIKVVYVSPSDKGKWNVKVEDGSVAFGSAYYNWAISAPYMKKTGLSFKDIYNYCAQQTQCCNS